MRLPWIRLTDLTVSLSWALNRYCHLRYERSCCCELCKSESLFDFTFHAICRALVQLPSLTKDNNLGSQQP